MLRVVGKLIVLLVLGATLYAPVRTAGFVWDDDAYVTENPNLHDRQGLRRIWLEPRQSPQYYPLVFTSFWLERQVAGAGPTVPHVTNVVLHVTAAALLWAVLTVLRVPGAWWAALLFVVHPVHVESVAWITERKNVLSLCWMLAAAWCYFRWTSREADAPTPDSTPGRGLYGAALVCLVAALLSKSVTAVLPLVLAAVLWWQGETRRRVYVALLPFVAVGAVAAAFTAWLEVHHVGAVGDAWDLPVLARLALAGQVVGHYGRALVWPHPLVFVYPRWEVDPTSIVAWLPTLAVGATLAALWSWRTRVGRAPLAVAVSVVVLLGPVLGFANVYPMQFSYVADHFQYHANAVAIPGLVALAWSAGRRWGLPRVPVRLCVASLVAVLAWRTSIETGRFQSAEALWVDTLAKNPEAWLARNNLGNLRVAEGRYAEARALFEDVIRQRPTFAVAHNNLGTAWFRDGRIDLALASHRRAVALDPTFADAHNNVGVDLANLGRLDEAAQFYRRSLELAPTSEMAHYNLANVLVRIGRWDQAEGHYRDAVRLRADFALARFYLGLNLLAVGRAREAEPWLEEAFRLKPDFPSGHYQVGTVLLQQGRPEAAAEAFTRALGLKSDYAEAENNLGSALWQLGRFAEAGERYARAVALAPRYGLAQNNLGMAREHAGRLDEAAACFREALRLDAGNRVAARNLERLEARRRLPSP